MGTVLLSLRVRAAEPAPDAPPAVPVPEVAPAPQPAPPSPATPPAAPRVSVTFRTSPDYELAIQGAGLDATADPCGPVCTHSIPPSGYQVHLMASGEKKASFNVNIDGQSDVVVSPGSPFLRGLGMAITVVGATAVGVGAFALYYDADSQQKEDRFGDLDPSMRYRRPDWVIPAMIAGAIGVGVTLGGVAIFVTAKPTVDVLPRGDTAARVRRTVAQRSSLVLVPAVATRGGELRAQWSY